MTKLYEHRVGQLTLRQYTTWSDKMQIRFWWIITYAALTQISSSHQFYDSCSGRCDRLSVTNVYRSRRIRRTHYANWRAEPKHFDGTYFPAISGNYFVLVMPAPVPGARTSLGSKNNLRTLLEVVVDEDVLSATLQHADRRIRMAKHLLFAFFNWR